MKEKIVLEYAMGCTSASLYGRISSEQGLSGWFAEHVDITANTYTFTWRKVNEIAHLISAKENHYIRFQWDEDRDSDYYFQFSINEHELTGDVSLIIEDFADQDEIEDVTNFWDANVTKLKRLLGNN